MSLNFASQLSRNHSKWVEPRPEFEPQGLRHSFVKRLTERRLYLLVLFFTVTPAESNVHRVFELLRGGNALPIPSGSTLNGLADIDRPDPQVRLLLIRRHDRLGISHSKALAHFQINFNFIHEKLVRGVDGLALNLFSTAHKLFGVLSFKTSELLVCELVAAV